MTGHEYVFRIMAQNKYGIGEPLDSEPEVARNLFSELGLKNDSHIQGRTVCTLAILICPYLPFFCSALLQPFLVSVRSQQSPMSPWTP